jgi:hypothetical protein
MAAPFSVEGSTPGTGVAGMDANGNIWSTGTLIGSALSVVTYNVTGTGTQGPATYNGIQTFNAGAGLNTSAEAAGTVLSTLLIAPQQTSGTQIGDLTRDYMCYVVCTAGGAGNTLTIGSTSAQGVGTIFAAATMAAGTQCTFRLPAGWYIMFNGTGTFGTQHGVPC